MCMVHLSYVIRAGTHHKHKHTENEACNVHAIQRKPVCTVYATPFVINDTREAYIQQNKQVYRE